MTASRQKNAAQTNTDIHPYPLQDSNPRSEPSHIPHQNINSSTADTADFRVKIRQFFFLLLGECKFVSKYTNESVSRNNISADIK